MKKGTVPARSECLVIKSTARLPKRMDSYVELSVAGLSPPVRLELCRSRACPPKLQPEATEWLCAQ